MKIKARLYFLSILACLGLIVVAAIGIYVSLEDSRVLKDIVDVRMSKAESLMQARIQVNNEVRRTYEAVAMENLPLTERVERLRATLAKKQEADTILQKSFDRYEALPRTPDAEAIFSKLKKSYAEWKPIIVTEATQELVQALNNPTQENLDALTTKILEAGIKARDYTNEVTELFGELVELNDKITTEFVAENDRLSDRVFYIQITSSTLLILAAIFLSFTTMRSVVGPVVKVRDTVQQVERENDLRMRVDYHSSDEVGEMVLAFNTMMAKLQTSFKDIQALGTVEGTVKGTLAEDAPLQHDLVQTLREVQRAARSLRVLTDLLGRNPESLLRGRPDDRVADPSGSSPNLPAHSPTPDLEQEPSR
ncbi:hypothetical protein AGMMS50256_38560 [Betaproteobacteria bacterium]|nr:hypothetical protein AGMMS50256_38560 [Betaproteobacteria bacterium]